MPDMAPYLEQVFSQGSHRVPANNLAIAIILSCSLEIDGKILLLKTLNTLVT